MIPILSCMQMAANMSGTATDAENSGVVEGSANDLAGTGDNNRTTENNSEFGTSEERENAQCSNNNKETDINVDSSFNEEFVESSITEDSDHEAVGTEVCLNTCDDELDSNDTLSEHSTEVPNELKESPDIHTHIKGSENDTDDNKTIIIKCSTLIQNNSKENQRQDQIVIDEKSDSINEEEVLIQNQEIRPKKSAINFFKKSYLEEASILELGSIDVDENVHEELERLNEKPTEKTWDEELLEINNCANNSDSEKDTETGDSDLEATTKFDATAETFESETNPEVSDGKGLNESQIEIVLKNASDKDSVNEIVSILENEPTEEEILTRTDSARTDIIDVHCLEYGLETIPEVTDSLEETNQCNTQCSLSDTTSDTGDNVKSSKPVAETLPQSIGTLNGTSAPHNVKNKSGFDLDLNDSEVDIERARELNAALLRCLKGKRGNFEEPFIDKVINYKEEGSRGQTTGSEYRPCDPVIIPIDIDINFAEDSQASTEKINEVNSSTLDVIVDKPKMPGTEDPVERSISPALLYASCKYRWERNILTQSKSVVFVTLNKKEIEPIKLEWSDSSRCFYSDELKVPVGVYVGNLVVDGTFYPVEDITVKHYTFEVDLYLKDDILEDEGRNSGVTKAEEFISRQQEGAYNHRNQSYTYSASRSLNFGNSATGARMEEAISETGSLQSEASIHLSSKYEELVRSQMNQNSLNGDSTSLKQDDLDLGGRRTPVGEDGDKQYQDGDSTVPKTYDSANTSQKVSALYDPLIDGFFENGNIPSHTSAQNDLSSQGNRSPNAVIDDVLGNGHSRTPIYSTESPVHSKHSSAHSSARQTPTTSDVREYSRPESVGSAHSANSTSRHVLDDLINDAMGRTKDQFERSSPASEPRVGSRAGSTPTRQESVGSAASEHSISRRGVIDLIENDLNVTKTPPPSKEDSISGSRPQTPPRLAEQISDVLNPSDRHSPIRREFLSGSPNVSNQSSRGSGRNSAQGSTTGSLRQTPQKDLITSALQASPEKLYSSSGIRRGSGSENGSNVSHASEKSGRSSSTSHTSSRPQSLTSEQELTQYYENLPETKDIVEVTGSRTGSASSLPAIGNQQRFTPDKRSMTPDNHIRVPAVGPIPKNTILTGRTPPRTPLSNASSRTVTPMNVDVETELKLREQMKELDVTLSSVKKQLSIKELEVMELKDQVSELRNNNAELQGDLDRLRARASPAIQVNELERKLREADEDKEALKDDIQRLKDELRQKSEPGLNSYDPNGRSALQRKIDDLTGQLQDLQEAHESASEKIAAADKKVKELSAENDSLRIVNSEHSRSVDDENRSLKAEIKWLRENPPSHTDAADYRLRIELQQVKDDNRNLRERNYQLHDDNIRLKEELSDLRKSFELMDSVTKTLKEERKPTSRKYDSYEPPVTAYTEKSLESSYHGDRDRGYSRRSEPLPERRADKNKDGTYNSRALYDSTSYDALRLEQARKEKDLVEDRFTKSESYRYESYRSGPDGGSTDKFQSSRGYPRTLTPERPSGLRDSSGSRSKDRLDLNSRTLDRSDIEHAKNRRERSRTSSAEMDFRSMPLSAYNTDLSQTTPALSGRSRDTTRKQHLQEPREDYYKTHDSMNISRSRSREAHDKPADSVPSGYDDGNMSDTPTDILVNLQPNEKVAASVSWSRNRPRRGSVGSDASNSSYSDIDEQITAAVRKRSKSADSREILRRMGPNTGTSKENATMSRTLSPAPSSGLRSITPRPIATQHNKSSLTLSSSLNSLTQGLRPFAPRSAQDLQIEDVIKFSRQGGKLSQGTVKFIGHLPGRGDIYLGVELDKEDGKHDGVFEGIRYFKSKPNKGVFVAYNKVVMAWTSY